MLLARAESSHRAIRVSAPSHDHLRRKNSIWFSENTPALLPEPPAPRSSLEPEKSIASFSRSVPESRAHLPKPFGEIGAAIELQQSFLNVKPLRICKNPRQTTGSANRKAPSALGSAGCASQYRATHISNHVEKGSVRFCPIARAIAPSLSYPQHSPGCERIGNNMTPSLQNNGVNELFSMQRVSRIAKRNVCHPRRCASLSLPRPSQLQRLYIVTEPVGPTISAMLGWFARTTRHIKHRFSLQSGPRPR